MKSHNKAKLTLWYLYLITNILQIAQNPLDSEYGMSVLINDLREKLAEKEEELHDMDILNQTLILREHMSNNELQAARKELINVSFLYGV